MLRDFLLTTAMMFMAPATRPRSFLGASDSASRSRPDAPLGVLPEGQSPGASESAPMPNAPGEPGMLWRDGKGWVRRVPKAHGGPRRMLNPHDAVMRFAAWMRAEGFSGWHPSDDIDEFYAWFCDALGVEPMPSELMRERFASAPGVTRQRRRLVGTNDREIQAIRRRMGGLKRTMLYRIADEEEMVEQARAESLLARPDCPPGIPAFAGRPGRAEKSRAKKSRARRPPREGGDLGTAVAGRKQNIAA